jgi:muramoyltetrapeptide carboxypeptidase
MIKPPVLKPNDRVGLVAPASRPDNPSELARAVRIVEEMGLTPIVGKNVLKVHGYMAGTDAERLSDLNAFIEDDSIRAIFCVTGGFGSLHLLPDVHYSSLKTNPKVIVGGDDNTSLITAIHVRTGLVTFAGPNLDKVDSSFTFDNLKQMLTSTETPPAIPYKSYRFMEVPYSPVPGTVSGALLGGNLTALVSLMGTPFQPEFLDTILFLEDIDERHDILDRWFTTLYVSGSLAKTSGIAFGDFERCSTKGAKNMLSLQDLYGDRLKELQKPSCFGLPFGQSRETITLPLGIQATLDSARAHMQFMEPVLS